MPADGTRLPGANEELRPEVWLPVVGFEGVYEASNLGRIRRVESGRILRPAETGVGYHRVTLCREGVKTTCLVNSVILSAFCGPRPFPQADAAHNDGDRSNNRLTNLRWATKVENQADIDRHGTRCRGEAVFGAKLTAPRVRAIRRRIARGMRNPPIAREFGVSISTIHLIRHKRIWAHVD